MSDEHSRASFEFGKNWSKLVPKVDQQRLETAKRDIAEFVGRESLTGVSFLDIGCGSGLSSLAAYHLGASPITSIDIDPLNVENVAQLRKQGEVPDDATWQVRRGDILNQADFDSLPKADLVYSWGVLHHTGQMWKAIDNAASRVNDGGGFYIMLYRDALLAGSWTVVKRVYVNSPRIIQLVMQSLWAGFLVLALLLRGKNPVRVIGDYPSEGRGMSWWIDIADWIGGYPFECARAQEVIDFLKERNFEIERMTARPLSDPFARPLGLRGTGSICYYFTKTG